MKPNRILVLGAGHSSPYLIRHLLARSAERDWTVTVADVDSDLAAARIGDHPRGHYLGLDASSADGLHGLLNQADLVVNLLPQRFQHDLARICLELRRPMVSASYASPELWQLDTEARRRDVLLLAEMGLDPGIDHMATMDLIDRVHSAGGEVLSFESYGSGVPAEDSLDNPLRYAITWNPRNVVMAGEHGARFLRDGALHSVPRERVFEQTWAVEVEGVGTMEAYANRDSLPYREHFAIPEAATLVRGTMRWPGWCRAWQQVVRLGLATESLTIPDLQRRSYGELVEMLLPAGLPGDSVTLRAGAFLGLEAGDPALRSLEWLGLFGDDPVPPSASNPAQALVALLSRRLRLPPTGRDLVILLHRIQARFPEGDRRLTATLVARGEPGGLTAMARTVGLSAAIAAEKILDGTLRMAGCRIPIEPEIYRPVLQSLAAEGLSFREVDEAGAAANPRDDGKPAVP